MDEEQRLLQKGEVERKRAAAREERSRQAEEKRIQAGLARQNREALESEKKEMWARAAEEKKLSRFWDLEQRREQETSRAEERTRATEAEVWWRRPGVPVRAQSADAALSRQQEWAIDRQRQTLQAEKEFVLSEDRRAREQQRRDNAQKLEQVKLEYSCGKQDLESEKERKRQQELLKRQQGKEALDAKRDRRLLLQQNRSQEAKARAFLEVQQREQRLFARQMEEQRSYITKLEAKGARERIIFNAQETRRAHGDLLRKSELHARTSQEARETFINEMKEKQQKNSQTRRQLEIDLKREQAEEAKLAREEAKRQEEEARSPLIFPLLPSPRLSPREGSVLETIDAALSARGRTNVPLSPYSGMASTGSL